MPHREWRLRIEDIVEAILEIQRFTDGMSLSEFSADAKTIKAVDYDFMVIGEAARSVAPDIQSRYPDIPWRDMADMRNVMAHEYFGVNPRVVWQAIQNDLAPLLPRLRAILDEHG